MAPINVVARRLSLRLWLWLSLFVIAAVPQWGRRCTVHSFSVTTNAFLLGQPQPQPRRRRRRRGGANRGTTVTFQRPPLHVMRITELRHATDTTPSSIPPPSGDEEEDTPTRMATMATATTSTTTTTTSSSIGDNNSRREVIFLEPGTEGEVLSDDLWEEIEGAQPPQWVVMKQILGIGGFTYVLGALIVLMLTLNAVLGPGWLGQAMGIQGTGTFTEVSSSLPDQIDLSADAYLL